LAKENMKHKGVPVSSWQVRPSFKMEPKKCPTYSINM